MPTAERQRAVLALCIVRGPKGQVSGTVVAPSRAALMQDIFTEYDDMLRRPGASMSVVIINEIEVAQ